MEKVFIKESLLYYSLKDILYNKESIFIYLNDIIRNIDEVLNEMLNTKILNKDGLFVAFNNIEWDEIENYYMFNTIEIGSVLKFIKENFLNKEVRVVIDTDDFDNVNELIEFYFRKEDTIVFYFKNNE